MNFWENWGETITYKTKEFADKAKAYTDIASLKGQIVSCENSILRYYKEIGRAYYKAHKNDLSNEFPNEFSAIADAERKIAKLKAKISDLKGTQKCASCGSDIANDSTFCSKCGKKVVDDTFFDEDDNDSDIVTTESLVDIVDDDLF